MPSRRSGSRSSSLEAVVATVAAALVEDLKYEKKTPSDQQSIKLSGGRLAAAKAFVEIQLHKGLPQGSRNKPLPRQAQCARAVK